MLKSTLPPVMRPLLKAKYCIVKMEMKDSFVNSKVIGRCLLMVDADFMSMFVSCHAHFGYPYCRYHLL